MALAAGENAIKKPLRPPPVPAHAAAPRAVCGLEGASFAYSIDHCRTVLA